MYHPMIPVMPFVPTFTSFPFFVYCGNDARFCQSSRMTSILPSAIAWKFGWPSVMLLTLTLQPSLFSSTYLTTYTFDVEPAHAFSFRVTLPHAVAREPDDPAATALATTASATSAITPSPAKRKRLE